VVILYPEGRVSPTQEAQLTMFNSEAGNVRAYAVAGSFDDCHRLTRDAFGDANLRRRVRLTSANSVNIGRLLPQMVYYFHAVAQLGSRPGGSESYPVTVCTPSGNFGNLTAGLMAKRAGLPIAQFVAATNVNDVVPEYLKTGHFVPRPSVQTIANAMDVGHPSNFERMMWLYHNDLVEMRHDITGVRYTDDEVKTTIRRVYENRGYVLDPHSAIAYMGVTSGASARRDVRIFLATAHPAKFSEVVEAVIGRRVDLPAQLAEAVARPRTILLLEASLDAVAATLAA
jgi:threonine synthase